MLRKRGLPPAAPRNKKNGEEGRLWQDFFLLAGFGEGETASVCAS